MLRLRPTIFLPASVPWASVGTLGTALTLWVSMTQAGLSGASFLLTDHPVQVDAEFFDGAVGGPGAEVAEHGGVRREVVRQVAPRDAGTVEEEDRVHHFAQVSPPDPFRVRLAGVKT